MEGSEERAREAARTDGLSLRYGSRPVDWYRLTSSVLEERMEQVREIDGEQAYEKMRRAVEKASQVERARQPVRTSSFRRAKGRSAVGRNAADRSGTLAPAASPVSRAFTSPFFGITYMTRHEDESGQ